MKEQPPREVRRLQTMKQTAASVERLQAGGTYPKGPVYALVNLVRMLADAVIEQEERRIAPKPKRAAKR